MKLEFKSEDFSEDKYLKQYAQFAADKANAKLRAWLDASPVHEWTELRNPQGYVRCKARLVETEEISKGEKING